MKKLNKVPFDKLYIGMFVCCLSPYQSTLGEIILRGTVTDIIKDTQSISIVWYERSFEHYTVSIDQKLNAVSIKGLNGTYLDPTRM